MAPRVQVLLLALMSLAGITAAYLSWTYVPDQAANERAGADSEPSDRLGKPMGATFSLFDHTGKTVTAADFAGTVRLVFFGFTHCPDVCPAGLSVMSQLLEDLGADARQVRALFISVDPERDTPPVMQAYVSNFPGGIVGLTGSLAQLEGVTQSFYAYFKKVPQKDGTYVVDHTATIYLLDRDGNFRGTIDIHGKMADALAKIRRHLAPGR